MSRRSYARFLAPLALMAFVLALFMVVSSSLQSPDGSAAAGDGAAATDTEEAVPGEEGAEEGAEDGTPERRGPRFYEVRPGDTLSAISERTGVSLEELQELNPDMEPQALEPGERLRLREG